MPGDKLSLITWTLFLPPSSVVRHNIFPVSPTSPALLYAMVKQLLSYSFIMMINLALLWSNNFVSDVLTTLVVVCIFTTVPAVFVSYLLLYVHYHHLDLFVSAGVHHVFLSHPEQPLELLDTTRAEHEFVSDVENYNEEYPQQILDDNSENSEAESAKMVLDHKDDEKPSRNWKNSLGKIRFRQQRRSWENLKVRGHWIHMND